MISIIKTRRFHHPQTRSIFIHSTDNRGSTKRSYRGVKCVGLHVLTDTIGEDFSGDGTVVVFAVVVTFFAGAVDEGAGVG